jgi:phage-related minor tail protein
VEANIKDFGQLREHLLKTYDPEIVDKFFQALEQRGVKTIDQLQNLTDRDAGGVIADMQALGVEFKEVGEQINDGTAELGEVTKSAAQNVKEATAALKDLTKQLGGKGLQKVAAGEPNDADVEAAYATGGIVSRPTKALMGEAGPEAILPLARKNGKLGVQVAGGYGSGSGMIVQIDARGATPGMEARIRSAMKESEDRAVRRMVRSLQGSGRM